MALVLLVLTIGWLRTEPVIGHLHVATTSISNYNTIATSPSLTVEPRGGGSVITAASDLQQASPARDDLPRLPVVFVAADDGATAAATCGGESFTADTNVVMADGSTKPLDEVKVGDKVQATDPKTGKTSAQTVTAVWVNHDTDLMDVAVKSGGKTSTIQATQHHLFWDATRRAWVEADQLATGDQLRTDDGTIVTVASTVVVAGAADMWDLTVSTAHDFYVVTTTANVLVHNCPVYRGPTDPDDPNYPDSSEPMKPRSAGQPNYAENTQAGDAANQVGLNPEQERIFHDQITGRGITSYSELVQIAQDVADGNVH